MSRPLAKRIRRSKPFQLAEYGLARALVFGIDLLPLPLLLALTRFVARIGFACARKRRPVAIANILRTGLATDATEARTIARQSFEHFAILLIESLKAGPLITPENWRDYIEFEATPQIQRLLDDPTQGVIGVTGHIGNWEIEGRTISFMRPVLAIARDMNNPYINRLFRRRNQGDLEITPKYSADGRRFSRSLKEGRVLAMPFDQYARRHALEIPFFGIPTQTYTTPAVLHHATQAPVVFGYCLRTGPMRFKLTVLGPVTDDLPAGLSKDEQTREILVRLTSGLEQAIREAPSQYLWAHRRWRGQA